MKINWKRVVIAGLWSEVLLLAIYLPARQYAGSAFQAIAIVAMLGSMFLGGFWAARRIDSRFLLSGALVGIVANIVFYILLFSLSPIFMPNESLGTVSAHIFAVVIKTLGSAAGGYVGGRLYRKQQSLQTAGTAN
jgi:putative membrane protein (TIGR04086 family)